MKWIVIESGCHHFEFSRGNKFQIVKGYHSDDSYNINLDAF